MNPTKDGSPEAPRNAHRERDAVSLKFMSWCFLGFAALLYLALFYEQSIAGRVVNVVSATLLASIGSACLLLSCRLSKKGNQANR